MSIVELFTVSTEHDDVDWQSLVAAQPCAYLARKCIKVRKSQPEIAIGTCSVEYGAKQPRDVIICPHRFLERGQIFIDCLHLLTRHEPGNELHRIAEVEIPGGSVDYFLTSVREGRIVDFVGIELQALDTTGTLWNARQNFLASKGIPVEIPNDGTKTYGVNWKMTAKTTMVQLHHKVETFEQIGKHLVLVLQDDLFTYMQREFNFGHIQTARLGDTMHFHAYSLLNHEKSHRLQLASRFSTDSNGVAAALGLQVSAKVEMEVILAQLQNKLSNRTLLQL